MYETEIQMPSRVQCFDPIPHWHTQCTLWHLLIRSLRSLFCRNVVIITLRAVHPRIRVVHIHRVLFEVEPRSSFPSFAKRQAFFSLWYIKQERRWRPKASLDHRRRTGGRTKKSAMRPRSWQAGPATPLARKMRVFTSRIE